MEELVIRIENENGLHARAAAIFVQETNKFESDIDIEFKGNKINGKSIIGVMSMGIYCGDEIKIIASGYDDKEAIERLEYMIKNELEGV